MQHDHVLKKLNFDLLIRPPGSERGKGLQVKYLLRCCCIPDSLKFDMQHDQAPAFMIPFNLICNITMFWKSWIFTFTPPRVRGVGVCGQDICYDVAAFVIPFNLICNMTMFWKSWILTFWPQPLGQWSGVSGCSLQGKYLLPCCCICNSL